MDSFERLKVETDFGITFQAMGLLHANRTPFMGREYYYPAEVPEEILGILKEHGAELTGLGIQEILFRFEAIDVSSNGVMKLVFEAELGPEWEQRLPSPQDAGGNRIRIERVFTKVRDSLKSAGHPSFESVMEPPSKAHMHGGALPQEAWRARLWCKSQEFATV